MKNAEVPTSDTSGHLPVGPPPQKRTVTLEVPHGRSSSVSTDTMVPEPPDGDFRRTNIIRHGTHVAVVKLSYFDILKAIFTGAKGLKQKLAAEVKWVGPSEDRIQHLGSKPHPYILDVSVYKSQSSEFIPARCVIDTGNTQGNIISERLVRRLGLTEYSPLSPVEEHGGKVATGHVHTVKGSVRVSWCHKTSSKMFNEMRFLVSESEGFDLVIGAASIWRENLLPAPNLGTTGYVGFVGEEDDVRNNLGMKRGKLESEIRKLRNKIEDAKEGSEKRKNEKLVGEKKRELEEVKKELTEYNREKGEAALQVVKGDKGKKDEKKKEKERKEKEKKEKKEKEKKEKEKKEKEKKEKEKSKSKKD